MGRFQLYICSKDVHEYTVVLNNKKLMQANTKKYRKKHNIFHKQLCPETKAKQTKKKSNLRRDKLCNYMA